METTVTGNATFHPWRKACHMLKFLQVVTTQCFFAVMVLPWLLDWMMMVNATFHSWKRVCHTPRFLQVAIALCCSDVMAVLLPVERTRQFHPISMPSWKIVFCRLTFLTKIMMKSLWDALVWMELKYCNWEPVDLTLHARPQKNLRFNWTPTCKILAWSCPMESCWM